MVWGRMDDQFESHPKVENLSLEAVGLWSVCWSRALSQVKTAPVLGFVAESYVRQRAGKRAHALVTELVRSLPGKTHGLWEPVDGGWLIHDFEQYLPKRRDPAEAAESGKRGATKRWQRKGRPIANSYPDSHTEATEEPPGEPEDSYAENGSHVTRACVPDPVPEEELTLSGDRSVPARAVTATEHPPNEPRPLSPADARCTAHAGVGDPGPCNGCRLARERAERLADRAAEQAARERAEAARNCPDCEGTHFVLDPATKHPTRRRCDHSRTRRSA